MLEWCHNIDVRSQITGSLTACKTVFQANSRQSSASLALREGIHQWPLDSTHKGSMMPTVFHVTGMVATIRDTNVAEGKNIFTQNVDAVTNMDFICYMLKLVIFTVKSDVYIHLRVTSLLNAWPKLSSPLADINDDEVTFLSESSFLKFQQSEWPFVHLLTQEVLFSFRTHQHQATLLHIDDDHGNYLKIGVSDKDTISVHFCYAHGVMEGEIYVKGNTFVLLMKQQWCAEQKRIIAIKWCIYDEQNRDHSEYGLSQWEKTLHCSVVPRWLSPKTEWSLQKMSSFIKTGLVAVTTLCG